MPIVLDGTQGISTPMYAGSISSNSVTPVIGMKNKIINGACVIDQRNAGASVTQGTSATYVTDRFYIRGTVASKFTGQQSTTAPTGFKNSLVCTSSSAYTVGASEAFFAGQVIEGFNIADLGWGSSSAATVTLSFWTRSSLTGTFGGSLCNYNGDRSYPFTYTISSANTWEYKTITIAGDTTGTWPTDNGGGIVLNIGLGAGSSLSGTAGSWAAALYRSATGATSVVGTNGATFYITGVQLEVGSTATSFDYRPYGTELALCQRYFWRGSVFPYSAGATLRDNANIATMPLQNPVEMRATATATTTGTWQYYSNGSVWTNGAQNSLVPATTLFNVLGVDIGTNAAPTLGSAWFLRINGGTFSLSAEL